MAEIDVTRLVIEEDMFEFSASRAERGENAGPETWANAKAHAAASPILSEGDLDAFRDHVRGFGAWENEEIDAWDATECNALFIQMVAGDWREIENLCAGDGLGGIDWAEAEKLSERGTLAGRVYASADTVLYYLGD